MKTHNEPVVDLARLVGAKLLSTDDAEWIDYCYQPIGDPDHVYDLDEIARLAIERIRPPADALGAGEEGR